MKSRISIILVVLFCVAYLINCGGNVKPEPVYAVGQMIPVGPAQARPAWINQEGGIISSSGEKYLWIKGEADSKFRKVSKRAAKADAQGRLSESISAIVATQFADAWETLGTKQKEDMEQIRQGLTAVKSRTTIRGFRLVESFREQLAPITSINPNGKPVFGKAINRTYVKMTLPYEKYTNLRDRVMKKMIKKVKPNSRQRRLIKKVEKVFADLDNNPRAFEISKPQPANESYFNEDK